MGKLNHLVALPFLMLVWSCSGAAPGLGGTEVGGANSPGGAVGRDMVGTPVNAAAGQTLAGGFSDPGKDIVPTLFPRRLTFLQADPFNISNVVVLGALVKEFPEFGLVSDNKTPAPCCVGRVLRLINLGDPFIVNGIPGSPSEDASPPSSDSGPFDQKTDNFFQDLKSGQVPPNTWQHATYRDFLIEAGQDSGRNVSFIHVPIQAENFYLFMALPEGAVATALDQEQSFSDVGELKSMVTQQDGEWARGFRTKAALTFKKVEE